MRNKSKGINRLTLTGLIITLGIVFGDIGTSPLYVMKAITSGAFEINEMLVYGALSCIFWTLTLQTTIKYVIITLRADNHGEGGIFALFALIRRKYNSIAILTMIGGSALLADGVITPAITVTSSIEGLRLINPDVPVVPVVLTILAFIFFFQQFGTGFVGKAFGPVMVIWFTMLTILGFSQIFSQIEIFKAVNPIYAIRFLAEYPGALILLGAVFLATTGAEALYSDLGHCGIKNIRVSWIFVKFSLLINYFGQGAWLISHLNDVQSVNPFYAIMPAWFLMPGIIIATLASIIASQALISGSYTLISEAVSLNLWPKIRILYPTTVMGQVYIPFVNWFLWIACSFVVIYFGSSSGMEAAYGLSITITMIMTTLLLSNYLRQKHVPKVIVGLILITYLTIEGSFLYANLFKFFHGGWLTIVMASIFFSVMYGWYFGRKIKNKYITFINYEELLPMFKALRKDASIPMTATNLVYITKANRSYEVESKIIYSIFNKRPKRANTYWLLHIDRLNIPDTFEYSVDNLIPGLLYKVEFRLGFKIEPHIDRYFRIVLKEMEENGEIDLSSHYDSLRKWSIPADFLFVNLDRVITNDYLLPPIKRFTMNLHNFIRRFSITDVRAFRLDQSNVVEEKVPIIIKESRDIRITRIN